MRTASRLHVARILLATVLVLWALALAGGSPAAGAGTATVTSPDGLNLRSDPNTQADILATIPPGAVVTLAGDPTSDMWYPVSFDGLKGWAFGAYLTLGSDPSQNGHAAAAGSSSAPPPPPRIPTAGASSGGNASGGAAGAQDVRAPASAGTTMVVDVDALNVRAAPSTTAPVETTLPQGAVVQVTGPANGGIWDPVTFNGLSGWADLAYLAPAGAAGVAAGASSLATSASAAGLTAATFGNPTLGKRAGPESGLPVASPDDARGRFIWPVTGRRISTVFQPSHQAIDIDQFPQGGNPAQATADGIVTFAGGDECCSYGLYVIVQHRDGYSSLYAHLSKVEVTEGQIVKQGQEVGITGNTGNSTGPHIHFAIYQNGNPLDPLSVLAPGAQVEAGADCYRC